MRSTGPRPSRPFVRALRRVLGIGRRAVDLFPFTPLGLVTASASFFALARYGVARVDLLYLVIGAVGLALAALSLVLSVLVAIGLRVALGRAARRSAEAGAPPLYVECGVRTPTGFSLPSLWYLPMIGARWSWTNPEASVHVAPARGRLHEEVTAARRGRQESVERRVEVGDAFALTRIGFLHKETRTVRAVPSTGALERIRLSRSIAAGDDIYSPEGAAEGERIDLRGYAPGDPIRFVLWKVFAKTRQLVVRTPERAISPARRAFAYVVTGRGDEAAAGVARKAVESGALGANYVLGADGVPEDARTADEALELLARSGSASRDAEAAGSSLAAGASLGGSGLSAFLRRSSPSPATRAIVFVPAFDGPWRSALLLAARARGPSPMHIVVCADGLTRERRPSRALRLLIGARRGARGKATPDKPRLHEVEALVRALAGTGAEVMLVDRAHGRVYAGATVLARAVAAPRAPSPPKKKPAPAAAPEGT